VAGAWRVQFLGLLVVSYVLEPLFSRLYILSVWTVGERIIAGPQHRIAPRVTQECV
jgi:hypothetical protein